MVKRLPNNEFLVSVSRLFDEQSVKGFVNIQMKRCMF